VFVERIIRDVRIFDKVLKNKGSKSDMSRTCELRDFLIIVRIISVFDCVSPCQVCVCCRAFTFVMESTTRFGGFSKTRRKDKDFPESTIKLCR
jgi:adenylate kinase family enzyme